MAREVRRPEEQDSMRPFPLTMLAARLHVRIHPTRRPTRAFLDRSTHWSLESALRQVARLTRFPAITDRFLTRRRERFATKRLRR